MNDPAPNPDAEAKPPTCPICRGSDWVAWVEDMRSDKPSLIAVPTTGPPNMVAKPCPECKEKP